MSSASSLARVLVLDDDEEYRDSLRRFLAAQGLIVDVASTTDEAERDLARNSYQMVIADLRFEGEGIQGDEFIIKNKPSMQAAKIVLNTGFSVDSVRHLEELRALGVTILEKGDVGDQLEDIIAETLRANRADQPDTKLSEQLDSSEEGYNKHFDAARDEVNELYSLANQLVADGKLSEAEGVYRKIIGVLRSETGGYIGLRDVLLKQGKTKEAGEIQAKMRERFDFSAVPTGTLETGPADMPQRESVTSEARKVEPGGLVRTFAKGLKNGVAYGLKAVIADEADRGLKQPAQARPASASAPTAVETKAELPAADRELVAGHRFSPEALRLFALAEALRRRLNQKAIFRSFLLFGLLDDTPTGLAGLFLSSLGISRDAMLELIERKLNRGAKRIDATNLVESATAIARLIDAQSLGRYVLSDNVIIAITAAFSDNVRSALSAAETVAAEQGSSEVQPDHIFIALIRSTEDASGWIGWMLGSEKAEWIRRTLADWSADTPFTEYSLRDRAIAAGLYSPASASSDAAAKDDLLNFKQSASAMVNIVLKQDTVPPLVVGVYGPWGSGKSTYLELVKKGLLAQYESIKKASDGSKAINLLVVEYDAWAYSDAPKLWAGLITKIAKKLDEDLGWWGRIKYLFKTHRARLVGGILLGLIPLVLAVPVVLLGLLKPLSAGLVSATAGPLISVISAWLNQRQAVYSNVRSLASKFDSAPASGVINSIQDEFRDALESWIKQKTGADAADATIEQRVRDNNLKIVVFIDELDRCPLERIVDILEAIKLFLAKEIFIVFMAVDTRVASEAIRLHYKEVRNPDLPREYLEKIVQLPLRVPTARGQHLSAYLKKFMPNVKDDEPIDAQSTGSSDSVSGMPTDAVGVAATGGSIATAVPVHLSPPNRPQPSRALQRQPLSLHRRFVPESLPIRALRFCCPNSPTPTLS
jgi:ActR/RegA family two-component response regulator